MPLISVSSLRLKFKSAKRNILFFMRLRTKISYQLSLGDQVIIYPTEVPIQCSAV